MIHHAFDVNMGSAFATPVASSDNTVTKSNDETHDANRRKKTRSLGYFVATMSVEILLGRDSDTARHEIMQTQALKSHGFSRQVIKFWAMLCLYTTDRGFFRNDMFENNYHDYEERIPLDLSVVAVAWDENDMYVVMNLD